jgi:hypothetical protein
MISGSAEYSFTGSDGPVFFELSNDFIIVSMLVVGFPGIIQSKRPAQISPVGDVWVVAVKEVTLVCMSHTLLKGVFEVVSEVFAFEELTGEVIFDMTPSLLLVHCGHGILLNMTIVTEEQHGITSGISQSS